MEEDSGPSKSHKERKSGRKAEKKRLKSKDEPRDADTKQRNPKAFAIQSVNKLAKTFHRAQDIKTKKHHIPVVDRTPQEPPPVVVALVGPPKVGKTTLMQCIIKNYTKQRLTNIQGPVTVVSGKSRRLTLIECPNDLSAMIDIAKVADLILLLVDAEFGFEMETFEFLNICQVHGMPRIMGVLTHLDMISNPKKVKKTKKILKHRFWTEIYQGAKLFYLSRMIYGEYQKMEIHNLCRFISIMKFRPLTWRSSHPYLLADRMEDITDPEKIRQEPVCNRDISLYGYVRGMHLKNESSVHMLGVGDQNINNITFLSDPCPLPAKGEKKQRRTLDVKERMIYAPMSGVGGIIYDKDAVYIDVRGPKSAKMGEEIVSHAEDRRIDDTFLGTITSSRQTIDSKLEKSEFSLLQGMDPVSNDGEGVVGGISHELKIVNGGRVRRKAIFQGETEDQEEDTDEESEEEDVDSCSEPDISNDDEENESDENCNDGEISEDEVDKMDSIKLKWKENLASKARMSFLQRQKSIVNLPKLVYGKVETETDEEPEDSGKVAGDLFVIKKNVKTKKVKDDMDCSKQEQSHLEQDFSDIRDTILDSFVTGDWNENEDAAKLLQQDEKLYGDFEDLETGEKFTSGEKDDAPEDDENSEPVMKKEDDREAKIREKRLNRKRKMKELFDKEYDISQDDGKMKTTVGSVFDSVKNELAEQARLNRAEFEDMDDSVRVQYEGYRPGMYVRIEIHDLPCELVNDFNPTYPLILGGLLANETQLGYVRVRVKRHRWYPKTLKTRNPLIFSMGWRRFQSLSMYYMEDHNLRQRYLKYTPQNMHCWALLWGPVCPQGTGFLAVQELVNKDVPNFRIAATGTILESDKSTQLVKKLKLIGYPYKIFKNTCFVRGMFNSALEVAKFEGAAVRTVSGIRGQIKKAVTDGPNNSGGSEPGSFRASFEDKPLMSDIVFCRTWCPVQVPKFYLNCSNLLLHAKDEWSAMKTVGQLRYEKGQNPEMNQDSLYKTVERRPREFNPLVIPKKLQKELPFKTRPKLQRPTTTTKRERMLKTATIREPKDRKIAELMQALTALDCDKRRRKRQEKISKFRQHKAMLEKEELKNKWRHKEQKKKAYATLGKMQK